MSDLEWKKHSPSLHSRRYSSYLLSLKKNWSYIDTNRIPGRDGSEKDKMNAHQAIVSTKTPKVSHTSWKASTAVSNSD